MPTTPTQRQFPARRPGEDTDLERTIAQLVRVGRRELARQLVEWAATHAPDDLSPRLRSLFPGG